jgi:hypothetical protein
VAERWAKLNPMVFDDNRKIVIRGAMRTWETGGGRNEAASMAQFVRLALKRLLNERWSIVIYDKYTEEAGYDTFLHYEANWWVHGVPTLSTWWNEEGILTRLKDGFGWGSVSDIGGLLIAAKKAIIEEFGEGWRVHVAKLPPGSNWSSGIWGAD